jgi:F-type H+-transporting ATPase subunit b
LYNKIIFLAESVPKGRVFAIDTQTLISIGIQLLNGIILAVALGFILYKPLKNFMQKRTERIQSQIDDTDAKMAEAKELMAEYNRKIDDISKERIEILEDARLKADNERKIILEEARQEADEIKKRSLESVLADEKHLLEETRLTIIELASLMAEKYIAQTIDQETQNKIFNETLAQMEGAKWQD